MKTIHDFFFVEPNLTLYHYTSMTALMGICEKRAFWASNIYYLNDSKEIVQACEQFSHLLRSKLIKNAINGNEVEFVRQLSEWVLGFKSTVHSIFVFSLSEERNLLSQWRSYTPHGRGVSIGLASGVVKSVAEKSEFWLAKCLYKTDDQVDLLESLLEKILITFRSRRDAMDVSKHSPEQSYYGFLGEFTSDVLRTLSIIKNSSFSEEKEWRLVSKYLPSNRDEQIKFRDGPAMIVPYIELELPYHNATFESVMLGPAQHENLAIESLMMYLCNKQICNTVSLSRIPYREW